MIDISRRLMLRTASAGMACALAGAPLLAAAVREVEITDHGAVGDGATINTRAIQRAIDACAADGGGTVVIPAGVFVSGSIFLKPRVHLAFRKGAVLKGSADLADYPLTLRRFVEVQPEALRWALINARGNHGLRITGPGTIDGSGAPFWHRFFEMQPEFHDGTEVKYHLPQLCFIQDCDDVAIAGVHFRDPAFWNVHFYRCRKVLVEDCRFTVPHRIRAPSSDGTDLDSCQDVTIRRCHYSVDDDSIVFKGTQGRDARFFTEAPPVERVHVHDCTFEAGLGAIVFGTNATTVRDIRVNDCDCSGDQPLVRFKLRPDTPGQLYERIHVKGVRLHRRPAGIWHGGEIFDGAPPPLGPDQGDGPVHGAIVTVEPNHGIKVPPSPPAHVIRDVVIEDVTGVTRRFGDLTTAPLTRISDVVLRRIDVTVTDPARAALQARGVRRLRVHDVRVNGAPLSIIA